MKIPSLLTRTESNPESRTTKTARLQAVLAAFAVTGGLSLLVVTPIDAATATGTMAVTANILDTCTLSVPAMPFGNYVGSTADAVTANVSATCTLGGVATLSANSGNFVSGASFQRNMQNPANTGTVLPYNLYTNTGHTTIWGDGTAGTVTIPVAGTGSAVNYAIYGNVPTSSVVYPGAYADSVTVTLSY